MHRYVINIWRLVSFVLLCLTGNDKYQYIEIFIAIGKPVRVKRSHGGSHHTTEVKVKVHDKKKNHKERPKHHIRAGKRTKNGKNGKKTDHKESMHPRRHKVGHEKDALISNKTPLQMNEKIQDEINKNIFSQYKESIGEEDLSNDVNDNDQTFNDGGITQLNGKSRKNEKSVVEVHEEEDDDHEEDDDDHEEDDDHEVDGNDEESIRNDVDHDEEVNDNEKLKEFKSRDNDKENEDHGGNDQEHDEIDEDDEDEEEEEMQQHDEHGQEGGDDENSHWYDEDEDDEEEEQDHDHEGNVEDVKQKNPDNTDKKDGKGKGVDEDEHSKQEERHGNNTDARKDELNENNEKEDDDRDKEGRKTHGHLKDEDEQDDDDEEEKVEEGEEDVEQEEEEEEEGESEGEAENEDEDEIDDEEKTKHHHHDHKTKEGIKNKSVEQDLEDLDRESRSISAENEAEVSAIDDKEVQTEDSSVANEHEVGEEFVDFKLRRAAWDDNDDNDKGHEKELEEDMNDLKPDETSDGHSLKERSIEYNANIDYEKDFDKWIQNEKKKGS